MSLTLSQKLHAIGIRLSISEKGQRSNKKVSLVDIEDVLIEAARQVPDDSKLFSLLCSWIAVHGNYVIVEKLFKKAKKLKADDIATQWLVAFAIFAKSQGYHKWSKAMKRLNKNLYAFDEILTKSAIQRQGAMSEFEKYNIFIPKGSLRIRHDDALSPLELAKMNNQYRNRLIYGASWRADIITAIQNGLENPYAISKILGCSYEPAYRVFKDYHIALKISDGL